MSRVWGLRVYGLQELKFRVSGFSVYGLRVHGVPKSVQVPKLHRFEYGCMEIYTRTVANAFIIAPPIVGIYLCPEWWVAGRSGRPVFRDFCFVLSGLYPLVWIPEPRDMAIS